MQKIFLTEYNEVDLRNLITSILQPIVASEVQRLINNNNNSQPTEETYLKRKDVCKLIGISLPTLVRLTNEGALKAKIIGGTYRYSKTQIDIYMNTSKRR